MLNLSSELPIPISLQSQVLDMQSITVGGFFCNKIAMGNSPDCIFNTHELSGLKITLVVDCE